MNPLPVVISDLRQSRSSALAIVALIAVAVALGVAVTSQERAVRSGTARAADDFDLLVGAKGSPAQFILTTVYLSPAPLDLVPEHALRRLQGEAGVIFVAPLVFGDSYRGFPIIGATSDFVSRGGTRQLAEGHVFSTVNEVVIGADVALPLGASFTSTHGQPRDHREQSDAPAHEGFSYVAVGRLPRSGTAWDRAIIAPVEALWRLHARPSGHREGSAQIGPPWDGEPLPEVSAIVVNPRSVADAYRLRARYRDTATMAVFPAEVLVEMYAMLGDARDLLWLIALVTQALVVAAVLLAVFATLAQRRRQLGVLRALGASRRYVFLVVWFHASALITVGASVGLLLGWSGAMGLSMVLHARTGLSVPVTIWWPEIGLVVILAAVGALLATIPSWLSYRQPVSSLLRS